MTKIIGNSAMALALSLLAAPTWAAAPAAPGAAFMEHWKSGLAELSSYAATTRRYGELRSAEAVLVFVYEEIDDKTRIKVETGRVPASRRVPVLKLNHVIKFNTGIYDYSVMTSVFAGLAGGPGVGRPFEPRKISFSSQEWCGQVWHQVLPRPRGLVSTLHSYFEAEGDAGSVLPWPGGPVHYEDEMPLLVRELDGEFLAPGGSRDLRLLPSLWERRKRHEPLAWVEARLSKGAVPEEIPFRGRRARAVKWTLSRRGHAMAYWVEPEPPRRLLAWDDGQGEKGELRASARKTYWELNGNKDVPLRRELGLTYGVGAGG
jgi:hypothetical protein